MTRILTALFVLLASINDVQAQATYLRLQGSMAPYQFEYPSVFTADGPPQSGSAIDVHLVDGNGGSITTIVVASSVTDPAAELQRMKDASDAAIAAPFTAQGIGNIEMQKGVKRINGTDSFVFLFTGSQGGALKFAYNVVQFYPGKVLTVALVCDARNRELYAPVFQHLVDSIRHGG